MFHFNKIYFRLAILLFVTEVLMALFLHDDFIRPYFGDVLVVILIYCTIKSFIKASVLSVAIFTLLFYFTIETMQYFKIVKLLGMQHSKFANTVIGNSFSWIDILAYAVGIIIVFFIEQMVNNKLKTKPASFLFW